jgi:hypothetical protein
MLDHGSSLTIFVSHAREAAVTAGSIVSFTITCFGSFSVVLATNDAMFGSPVSPR